MEQYVGLDVSLKETSLCVVDQTGATLWQGKCASTPESIAAVLARRASGATRIGLESAGCCRPGNAVYAWLVALHFWPLFDPSSPKTAEIRHFTSASAAKTVELESKRWVCRSSAWMRAMPRQPYRCGSTRRMPMMPKGSPRSCAPAGTARCRSRGASTATSSGRCWRPGWWPCIGTGVHQSLLRHSAAVKRTAREGEPNGRNDAEGRDGAGGLVGAPPRSWRRQVRRRATWATLLGEAEAAGGEPAAAGRTTGSGGTGAQRHGGAVVGMAGAGFAGRRGGAEGARARRPRQRDRAAEGKGRRDDHGDRAVAGEDCPPRGRRPFGTPEVEAMSQAVSPSADRVLAWRGS